MSRWSILSESLRTGMWPVPMGMLALGILLFGAALGADETLQTAAVGGAWWLHSGSGDDARNLISTLLTAIITMSSLVFSITIVALSLAANQFGSRLIRTYITNVRTKLALGLFTMTIVYCLLALFHLEQEMSPAEVPHFTVTVGALLGLICVLALLLFLHLVARAMVADEVIRRAARELEESIAALPPLVSQPGEEAPRDALPDDFDQRSVVLRSQDEGYVELIEYERLCELAAQHDVVIRLDFRAGVFMCRDGWLGAVYPIDAVTPEIAEALQGPILIGERRTPTQDLEFSIRHLVDIAMRALSPGINDPNSALVVIDHLRGALSRLMGKALPTATYRDGRGRVRVVGRYNSHAGIVDSALHQIRQAAGAHPAVIINLLGAIGRIAEHATLAEQLQALRHHARLVAAAGLRNLDEPCDRTDVEQALAGTEAKLALIERREVRVFGREAAGAPGAALGAAHAPT